MALMPRSPAKLVLPPSTAPNETMVASLQAHVDDLVQKLRTCEHEKTKLLQELAREKERGTDHARRAHALVQRERGEWADGVDALLAAHRVVHLRTRVALDKERERVLHEREENRKERLNVLGRDYRLTLFQAREFDLELRIEELEDEVAEQAERHALEAQNYVAQYELQVQSLYAELHAAQSAKEDALAQLQTLTKEVYTLKVCASFSSSHNF